MLRDYELMYIVRPELDDDAVRTTVKSVRGLIEAQGGDVVKTTLWGKRRLAYEVQHLRDGHYVLVVLHLDPAKVSTVARALRIHDTVFRHLLVTHEGEMPEADGNIDEVELAPPDDGAAVTGDAPGGGAGTVAAASAENEQDVLDEDVEVPSASDEDDEGDV
jgi:small subunit ribosomal protein S6